MDVPYHDGGSFKVTVLEKVPLRERYRQSKRKVDELTEQVQILQDKLGRKEKRAIVRAVVENTQRDIYLVALGRIIKEGGFHALDIAQAAIAEGKDPELITKMQSTDETRFEWKMKMVTKK